jgi:hypothetical protein
MPSRERTPQVAQNTVRLGDSAIHARTGRHLSYAVSLKNRMRIEACFGWLKHIVLLRKLKHRELSEYKLSHQEGAPHRLSTPSLPIPQISTLISSTYTNSAFADYFSQPAKLVVESCVPSANQVSA